MRRVQAGFTPAVPDMHDSRHAPLGVTTKASPIDIPEWEQRLREAHLGRIYSGRPQRT
jgi:hypothetical protein